MVGIQPPPGHVPRIRVLLFDNRATVKVRIRGPYQVLLIGEAEESQELASGDELGSRTVRRAGIDVIVDGLVRTPGSVEFVPRGVPVELDDRRYRGRLRIGPSETAGKLRAINVVDLEGYVRGVVPCEAIASWPAAALEAQAIAARTYGLLKRDERKDEPFDVRATSQDQNYGGQGRETDATNAAVQATAGRVLHHDGRPLTAYYHSSCGGHTADAWLALADADSPLRGVPCRYCTESPRHRWRLRVSLAELRRKLRVKSLTDLTPQGVGPADGRVARLILHRGRQRDLTLTGVEFRRRVGTWKRLRGPVGIFSTKFTVTKDGSDFVFDGRGWGHGAGMCQWGAKGMADVGKACAEILAQYYPGATVTRAYR